MEFLLQKEKFYLSSFLYLYILKHILKLWNLLRKTAAHMLSDY